MNQKEYLILLAKDLNLVFKEDQNYLEKDEREKENLFRIKVMTFHLHADYLLTEIINKKFRNKLTMRENRENFDMDGKDFMEKLRILYANGNFSEDLFNTFRILNKIRNNLNHNLLTNIKGENQRIKSLKINSIFSSQKKIEPLEHLLYACVTHMSELAIYLYSKIIGEKSNYVLKLDAPKFGQNIHNYPLISVVELK